MRWIRSEGVETPASPQVHHVWVSLTRSGGKREVYSYPGLVLDWRRTNGGWEALVTYVTIEDFQAVHMLWVPAEQLTPVRDDTGIQRSG